MAGGARRCLTSVGLDPFVSLLLRRHDFVFATISSSMAVSWCQEAAGGYVW